MNKLLILFLTCSYVISEEAPSVFISANHAGLVRIPSSPSTGYKWWYVPNNSALIRYIGEYSGTYVSSNNEVLGAEGYQEFRFECTSLCTLGDKIEVLFRKVRMFDSDTVEYKKLVLKVVEDAYFEGK